MPGAGPAPARPGEFQHLAPAACRTGHAGIQGEDTDHAGGGKNPPHLRLRRGQQQVTASLPSLAADTRQRGQVVAIDEFQAGQIDDDLAPRGR
jgi:hypothetical protein